MQTSHSDKELDEYWRMTPHGPDLRYSKSGFCAFTSTLSLMRWLREMGMKSERHREAFLSYPGWTALMSWMAMDEGWAIEADGSVRSLPSECSKVTAESVAKKAKLGDPLYMYAVKEALRRKMNVNSPHNRRGDA